MKKLISAILLVLILATAVTGCGEKEVTAKNRVLYNSGLSEYVELGEYKNIKVDTSTDDFKEYYNEVVSNDVEINNLYVKKTEGTVAEGDVTNIDYVGKKDGVAFEGGTAAGYDLEIGSGQFIDGFEDGLIGVAIGDKVDLNLTFPEAYDNADLAGAAVVFTVKVNYVKTDEEEKPENYYKELDFETLEAYQDDVRKRAIENLLFDTVCDNSEIKEYPQEDTDTIYNALKNTINYNLQNQYGVDFETYLSAQGQTEEGFKATMVEDQIGVVMDTQMVMYAILDNEEIEFEQKDIDAKIKETLESIGDSSVTEQDIIDYYGEYYFEEAVVNEKVMDFLYNNAKIS